MSKFVCTSVCFARKVATHRQHSEDCVDGPDSYSGIDRLSDTSPSKDTRRVVKDLKDQTSTNFVLLQSQICVCFAKKDWKVRRMFYSYTAQQYRSLLLNILMHMNKKKSALF